MLRLLGKILENKAKYFIGKTQFGFRIGFGTREAISVMRLVEIMRKVRFTFKDNYQKHLLLPQEC